MSLLGVSFELQGKGSALRSVGGKLHRDGRRDDAQGEGVSFWPVDSGFLAHRMQQRKLNHALRKAQPCKLPSGTMQVAEWNHASLRVHGSA